jgi:hypothetical protein
MCLRRALEKYIAGAALDRAGLDSRLTAGGKVVVSLPLRPCSTPQKHFLYSWYPFMLEAERTQGHIKAGRIR